MNLTTSYMGMTLKNPIVPSASPLSAKIDNIRRMEDVGAAAVVMYSLFEEQIVHESHQLDHFLSYGTESFAESLSYFPDLTTYNIGPDQYLDLLRKAKQSVGIPIIGSLNAASPSGWIDYARRIEQTGVDALELNIYFIPTNPDQTSEEVEETYLEIVREVKKLVKIPVAVKLSPFFSSTPNMAKRLAAAGADALVLFNRFYQPDFDLEALEVVPNLVLSTSDELRLPLRWVAILHGRISVDFAITTGIHNHEDVLKGLMAGAKVTMMTSELLEKGIGRIAKILGDLSEWMEEHEYQSVTQMQGSMCQMHVADPSAFERANYMKVLQSWSTERIERRGD
jgi:dihydroorotate dehydrogenase (fumarate)